MGRLFDGTDDVGTVTRAVALEPAAVTCSLWFKGSREGNFRYLLAKVLLAGDWASYGFHTGDATNQIAWSIGWGTGNLQFYRQNADGAVLYDGGWHHLCGTYDPGQNPAMRIYIAGAEAATALTAGNAIAYNTGQDVLLGNFAGLSLHKSGNMAHYALWKMALGSAAVAALGAGANPLTVQPANLVEYNPIGGVDNPEPDSTGNGHTIAITGTTKSADDPPVAPARHPNMISQYAGFF